MIRLFTEKEAEIYGRRRVCYKEGHQLESAVDMGLSGGVQMSYDRQRGEQIAACDEIACQRCDAIITVEYSPIGTLQ